MQLFSYYLHPYIFPCLFSALSCFITCIIQFPIISLALSCFQHVLLSSQHVYQLFHLFYCFDVVGLAFLGQDMSNLLLYVLFPCLCLDLHVHVLKVLFGSYTQCFYGLISLVYASFLCLAFGQVEDLDPVVQAYIHTPKFFNKVFGLVPLCMFVLCLHISMCLCFDPCLFA